MKSPITLRGVARRLQYSKRLLINRRGDGVHSPFAFHFITRVVRNRRPYYCFEELRGEVKRRRKDAKTCPPIHRARTLELLFRTAHELEAKNILVVTSQPTTSLLPDYLRHTGYTEAIYVLSVDELQGVSLPYYDLLICEYLPEREVLEQLLSQCISTSPTLAVALYTPSPRWRRFVSSLDKQVAPRLALDLMDLCLYFYDKRLTPSRYKGVY